MLLINSQQQYWQLATTAYSYYQSTPYTYCRGIDQQLTLMQGINSLFQLHQSKFFFKSILFNNVPSIGSNEIEMLQQ